MSIDVKNYSTVMMMKETARMADEFEPETHELGVWAAECFEGRHKAQIRGLENIAYSTNKVTDVKDYIKTQTGRHKEWQKKYVGSKPEWKNKSFGTVILSEIGDLSKKAESIQENIKKQLSGKSPDDEHEQIPSVREIHLLLIRDFVKQLSAQFLHEQFKKEG